MTGSDICCHVLGERMKLTTWIVLWGLGLLTTWTNLQAQTLHLTTENYPPFNMSVNGKDAATEPDITGISTDIVRELFRRAGVEYTIRLYPWIRAYKIALETPNHGVYSTTRTEARETLFRWVGPLVETNWVFLAKKARQIKITSLDDARPYRIGGYSGDATALYLEREQGFTLHLTPFDAQNARKIARDRIDLWATGALLGPYLAQQEGVTGLEQVFQFKQTIMSIAFHKTVPMATIDQLNRVLQQMRQDGTIAAMYQRYR